MQEKTALMALFSQMNTENLRLKMNNGGEKRFRIRRKRFC